MYAGTATFANCPYAFGELRDPVNTNLGITEAASEETTQRLGRFYWAKGPDGKQRVIRIVKATGATITKRLLCKYSTSTGRFGLDVLLATVDQGPPAGAVEEGYGGGATLSKYFRMVVGGIMGLVLQTTSDSRNTIAVGGICTCAADDGTFTGQSTVSLDAIQNAIGRALEACTNVTDAAAVKSVEISLLR